ncbi:hypothetical protein JCM6882_004651 [Rhodosporidiobolus microsporus]
MGASSSRVDSEVSPGDATFFADRNNVAFSDSLINHLSTPSSAGGLPSPAVPASRQQALDAHIQQRLAAELAHLRSQEQQVRDEIERALEKENLDRERGAGGAAGAEKGLSHSASLFKDLEELEKRSAGLRKEREETAEWKAVDEGKLSLVQCFRNNKETPLNCRAEADKFKAAVAGIEQAFFATAK